MSNHREQERAIMEKVRKEMETDTPEATDMIKAYAINALICSILNIVQVPLLFISVAIYCGTIGKVALGIYVLNKFGDFLDRRHKKALNKMVDDKMKAFADKLAKEEGCHIEFVNMGKK